MQSHFDIEMNTLIKKKERLRRIQEIEAQSKSTTSTAWYLLTWNFLSGMAGSIQEAFRVFAKENPIFSILYPDHPGTKSLLPAIAYSTWSMALKVLSPVTLAFSWVNTILAFKRLWQKPERTLWDYADAGLSLAGSIAWTVLFAVGAAGAAAAISSVLMSAPYLIPAIFGAYALYGFAKCVKNCVQAFWAWRAGESDQCRAYLKNAGKELVSVVINTLALVTSIFLGIKMHEAIEKLKNLKTFEAGKEAINYCFDKATALLYALGAAISVGVVINTRKMNEETINVLRHPIDSIKQAWYAAKSDPLLALKTVLTAPIKLPLRIAALVITGPIHGIVKLGSMALNWWRNRKKSSDVVQNRPSAEAQETVNARETVHVSETVKTRETVNAQEAVKAQETVKTQECVKSQETVLGESKSLPEMKSPKPALTARVMNETHLVVPTMTDARIKEKLKKMDAAFPSLKHAPDEVKAKRFHLAELSKFINGQSSYRSVEEIERHSQLISRQGLYRSNFRMKGSEVKELTEEVRFVAAPAA